MNNTVKMVIAAAMTMGVVASANAVNTGKVTFKGKIEESPCSIVVGDEDQTINMGHIGTGSLIGGKKTTAVSFHIGLQDCTFTDEKTMTTTFQGVGAIATQDNLALMGVSGELKGASLVIGDSAGNAKKLGDAISQKLILNSSGVGLATQQADFKAWLVGDTGGTSVDLGEFTSVANFQIEYQ
ncbi:fimbrial protein [Pseudocitrobacter cyperus]|uniref:Fimbrial protein n=1 Tax=Pseudocitrobacter cyperus TaxID=3112843 RepID=A0ABV0HIW1_9ENTR